TGKTDARLWQLVGVGFACKDRLERRSEQAFGIWRGKLLHAPQLALDGASLCDSIVDGVRCLLQSLPNPSHDVTELAELGLHGTQDRPDFTRPLLDRQRAEAHLQAVQQRE